MKWTSFQHRWTFHKSTKSSKSWQKKYESLLKKRFHRDHHGNLRKFCQKPSWPSFWYNLNSNQKSQLFQLFVVALFKLQTYKPLVLFRGSIHLLLLHFADQLRISGAVDYSLIIVYLCQKYLTHIFQFPFDHRNWFSLYHSSCWPSRWAQKRRPVKCIRGLRRLDEWCLWWTAAVWRMMRRSAKRS